MYRSTSLHSRILKLAIIVISIFTYSCNTNRNSDDNYFYLDQVPKLDSIFIAKNNYRDSSESKRPNIILIYIDDLGYGDIGAYGCKDIPTPNIDRLANEGIILSASYITNPPCSPSRSSLLTGQYAQKFGKYGMSRGLPLPEDRPTLARVLKDNGYVTGHIGKWDVGSVSQNPLNMGFAEVAKSPPRKVYSKNEMKNASSELEKLVVKREGRSKYIYIDEEGEEKWLTDYDGESAVDFINRHQDEPFFLFWSPEAVHSSNVEVPARLTDRTLLKNKSKRQELGGAIVSIDDQIMKILNELENHNLREKTLIIFSSDNGPGSGGSSAPYSGGKGAENTQYEGWVRIPTIFSMPGSLPQGVLYDKLVANFDFYSTISALAIQKIPQHCDGVDLFPYLKGEIKDDAHDYLFWLNNDPNDEPHRHLVAARWQNWRISKKNMSDNWELYDLREDPKEEDDLTTKYPDIVNQMAQKHSEWIKTLSPLKEVMNANPMESKIPEGYGWEISSAE